MPTNLTSPDTARFGVYFNDPLTGPYTPSSAAVNLTYLVNNVSNSSSVTLATSGGRWVADWSSAVVDVPSNVTWTVTSSCTVGPAQIGVIRIIDP